MILSHSDAMDFILKHKLIAILRHVPEDKLDGVVSALIRGGVRVLEFTFDHNSESDLEANARKIQAAADRYGSELLLGCGTVLTAAGVFAAYEAGARLVISPNVKKEVIQATRDKGMVSMPGAMTPTEIVEAWEAGADLVKLFPAGELGVSYIRAVRGPLSHIPMSAVGGVKPENIGCFLDAGICCFGIGGQLVLPDAVQSGAYSVIEQRAAEFVQAVQEWEEKHA